MHRIPIYRIMLMREGSLPVVRKRVEGPQDAAEVLRDFLADTDREHFVALLLDAQCQLIGIHTVAIGSLDTCIVHPRELFKAVILANAASIILAHNHPSGDPTPSLEDRTVTRQLADAGEMLGIDVQDHVIIGEGSLYCSFMEAGLLS